MSDMVSYDYFSCPDDACIEKIDQHGTYLPFPGMTIVMMLKRKRGGEEEKLFQELCSHEAITSHVALLPIASYHVTLRGICTRMDFGSKDEYMRALKEKEEDLRKLDELFKTNCKNELQEPLRFEFDRESTIKDPRMFTIVFKSAQNNEAIVRKWEHEAKVRLGLNEVLQHWHMTLGYIYKPKEMVQCNEHVQAAFLRVVDFFDAQKDQFIFETPRVCWFHDMTEFIPIKYE